MNHGALSVTTPNDTDIVVTRFFKAPPALVFDAHTKPELVRRWLYGPSGWTWLICEIDLKPGGSYLYRWRHADGRELGFRGVYRQITPPTRLVHTERMEGGDDEIVSTLELSAQDGGTRMTQTMRTSSKATRDAMIKTGMTRGMEAGYERLDAYFASVA